MHTTFTRRRVLGGMTGAGTAALAGCLGGLTSDDGVDPPEADSSTDREQLSVALEDDPTADTWDTYGYATPYYTKVVEPLVWASESMETVPWLATDWEALDETTWEFSLREGVRFHNGEELTAEDVVWSFERLFDRGDFVYGWLHLAPENVVAVDDHTVEFTTTEPFAAFPGTIAHNMVCVQHPDSADEELGTIGTGPLEVTSVERGDAVETTPFDDYWGDRMETGVEFAVLDDATTRSLSLEAGDVDVIFNPPRSRVSSYEADPTVSVLAQQSPRTMFAPLNLYRSPTDEADFRRALNYAVSQVELTETVLEGVDDPARGPISPIVSWSAHDDVPTYERDREHARELVESSSYDGEALSFVVHGGVTNADLVAEALQGSFADIGVETDIRLVDSGSYSDVVREDAPHLGLRTSGSNSAAADYIMFENFHSEGINNIQAYEAEGTGLYNLGGEVDELIETAYRSRDLEETADAYREAQVRIVEEAVCIPVCYIVYVIAAQADVTGIDPHPIDKMVDWSGLSRTGDE
ncbi:ABC transporter substrate-binding protein [Natronobiforma cellulositropha]|uniref:ABC transporter substrate-binding protein n=1 Tax=Natronobiforma cellulositropha TaxID=1679076 RepID=UPI0021D5E0EC|nr:ABC transporter substrate-binding protein [Natronobiforma cellulositropha]